jgi:hypothetical protein
MIKIVLNNIRCRFWHRWKLISTNDITKYYECLRCYSKKVVQIDNGYQPINWKWLNDIKIGSENGKSTMFR